MKKLLAMLFFFIILAPWGCGGNKGNTPSAPAAPAHLAAVAGNAQVILKWNASAGAASYKVYGKLSSDPSFRQIGTTSAITFTVTGLTNGQTYFFAIIAINAAGSSGYSNEAGATLIAGAPTDLTGVSGDQQASLSWNTTIGATSYNVYFSTASGGPYTKVHSASGASFTTAGLTNGSRYYFVVTAVNSAGESGYSNETSVTPVFKKVYPSGGYGPVKIAIDSTKNIWVTNFSSFTVTKLSNNGIIIGTYLAGCGPGDIAISNTGNVWVTNRCSNDVAELGIGVYPAGTSLSYPVSIAIDSVGNVWVGNTSGVAELSPTGAQINSYAVGSNFFLFYPASMAIDNSNNLWIVNEIYSDVTELSPTGTTIGTYAVGYTPIGIAIDSTGNVWVVNNAGGNLTKLSPAGKTIGTYNVGTSPNDIAIDASGNVWVTTYWSNTIRELNSDGTIIGTYAVGANPLGIAIDSTGNVWVADYGDNTVTELIGAATGPQYFPYTGPQWP